MRVMQLMREGEGDRGDVRVELAEMPEPRPGPSQVLVRVRAAGVIPTEVNWQPTWHDAAGAERNRPVPCHEFAGQIAALGAEVRGLAAGDAVYGMNDWFGEGALADLCLAEAADVAPIPAGRSYAEAAAVPISALTAHQALFERLQIVPGERVLIQGGAGAVGTFAVQMAKAAGAYVLATAAGRDAAFVRDLGADAVVDYTRERFEDALAPVDALLDAVGGATLERSWSVLKPGGRLVSIASEDAVTERDRAAFLLVRRDGSQLREIGRAIATGRLRVLVKAVAPWSEAAEAFLGTLAVAPGSHGKVVVAVTEDDAP